METLHAHATSMPSPEVRPLAAEKQTHMRPAQPNAEVAQTAHKRYLSLVSAVEAKLEATRLAGDAR